MHGKRRKRYVFVIVPPIMVVIDFTSMILLKNGEAALNTALLADIRY